MKGKRKTALKKKLLKPEKTEKTQSAIADPPQEKAAPPPIMSVEAVPTAETLTTPSISDTTPIVETSPAAPPSEPAQTQTPEETASALDHKNNFLFIVGLVVFLITIVSTGLFAAYLFTRQNAPEDTAESEVVTLPSPSPVEEELDREQFVFEVLNGSGVAGAAAKAKTTLEELGYVVSKTGNADSQDYSDSEIYLTEDLEDWSEQLLDDLEGAFKTASYSGTFEPDEESTTTARLILGQDQ